MSLGPGDVWIGVNGKLPCICLKTFNIEFCCCFHLFVFYNMRWWNFFKSYIRGCYQCCALDIVVLMLAGTFSPATLQQGWAGHTCCQECS